MTYVEEASTIGLRPGDWPNIVRYGNSEWRRQYIKRRHDGEVVRAVYRATDSDDWLEVIND